MKWWFLKHTEIETNLSADEIIERIKTIARPTRKLIDSLNPEYVLNDTYKAYSGTIKDLRFKLKKKYYSYRSRSMSLLVYGQIENGFNKNILHLKFTVPKSNLLWFLFPPVYILFGAAYLVDSYWLHHVPVIEIFCLILFAYSYWWVLAQFKRNASNVAQEFTNLLNDFNSNTYSFTTFI